MSKDGGQAFPVPPIGYHPNVGNIFPTDGMTLRDYFAAHATEEDIHFASTVWFTLPENSSHAVCPRETARYYHADLMIAEREKQ